MTEQELRVLVKESGVKLLKEGLVQGTWGNTSVRLDEERMIVTPSGLDYIRLKPEDMVVVNIYTLEYEGNLKPTSERKLHAAIYRERKDIGAVIHSHPSYCCSIASARCELPVMNERMKELVGGSAKMAAYTLPGTKKMTVGTMEALEGRNACFMANHGVVCCGKDMDEAFEVCRLMEDCSRLYIEKKTAELSGKTEFSKEDLKALFLKRYAK